MYPARPSKRRKITNTTFPPIYGESTNKDGSIKLEPSLANIHHEVLVYSNRLTVSAIAKIFGMNRETFKIRLGNISYEDRMLTVEDLSKLSIEEAKKIWGQTYYQSILSSQYKLLTDYSLRDLHQYAKQSSNIADFTYLLGIYRQNLNNFFQRINLFSMDLSYLDEIDIKFELKEEQYNKKIEFGSCFNLSIITLKKMQRCIQHNIPIGIDIELLNSYLANFTYRGYQLNLDMMRDASFNLLEVDYGPDIKSRLKLNLHGPIYVESEKINEYQEDETFLNTGNANPLIQTSSSLNVPESDLMQANTFQILSDILNKNDFQYIDPSTGLIPHIENSSSFDPLNEVVVLEPENIHLKNLTNNTTIYSPNQNPQNINDASAVFLDDAIVETQPDTSQDLSYFDPTFMSHSNNNLEVSIQTQFSSASLEKDNDKLLATIKDNISPENLSNENDVLEYLCHVENESPALLTTNIEHSNFSDFVKKITAISTENNNLNNTLIVDSTFDQLVDSHSYPNFVSGDRVNNQNSQLTLTSNNENTNHQKNKTPINKSNDTIQTESDLVDLSDNKSLRQKHKSIISQKSNKKPKMFYPSLAAIHRILLDNKNETMDDIAKRFNTTRFTLAKLLAKKTLNGIPLTLSILRDEISVEQAKALWDIDYDKPLGVIRGIYKTTHSSLNSNQAHKLNIKLNNQQAETTIELSNESLISANNSINILDTNGVAHYKDNLNLKKNNISFYKRTKTIHPSLSDIHKLFLQNPEKNSADIALMLNITRKTLYNWLKTKIYKNDPLTFIILKEITEEEAKKVWEEDYNKPIIQSIPNNILNNEDISHQQTETITSQSNDTIQTEFDSSRLENNLTPPDMDGSNNILELSDESSVFINSSINTLNSASAAIPPPIIVDSPANDISNQADEFVRKIIPGLSNEKIKEHSQYILNYLYQQRDLIAHASKQLELLTGKSFLQQNANNQNSTILNKNRLFTPANNLTSRTENVDHNEDDMRSGCIP